jgi:heme-degrading monooxygenase HmoA
MIERVWLARTTRDGATRYAEHFRRVVMPELAAIAGYRGARLLERELNGGIEIVVVTHWQTIDAIRAFAGEEIDRAVVHDEAAVLFSDYDRKVRHFGVVVSEDIQPAFPESASDS